MKYYGMTDKGLVRDNNQDTFGTAALAGGLFLALVCDGMGGAAGGAEASEISRDAFINAMKRGAEDAVARQSTPPAAVLRALLRTAADAANDAVFDYALRHPDCTGMGTTLIAALYQESTARLCVLNVGDSRIYRITERTIRPLTKDHSYVRYLLERGEITEEEAENHPQRNIITRAVGIGRHVESDLYTFRVPAKKTAFLLCSDGLYGMVDERRAAAVVRNSETPEDACRTLVDEANAGGGADNITACLLIFHREVGS